MFLKFEVKLDGTWVEADCSIVLHDGRLGYKAGANRGVASPPYWRHTEETTRQPEFRRMGWDSLTKEEKEAGIARMGGLPTF